MHLRGVFSTLDRNRFYLSPEPPGRMTLTIVGSQLGDEGKGALVDRWGGTRTS